METAGFADKRVDCAAIALLGGKSFDNLFHLNFFQFMGGRQPVCTIHDICRLALFSFVLADSWAASCRSVAHSESLLSSAVRIDWRAWISLFFVLSFVGDLLAAAGPRPWQSVGAWTVHLPVHFPLFGVSNSASSCLYAV